jgi:hypothetical protein
MTDDTSNGRPWTEEEWERFMQKSDVRSAKFGELLETLRDDPGRDEIIAHEMGWDRDRDDEPAFEMPDPADVDSDFTDEEWEEICRRDEEALHAIPAYSRGFEWGLKVHKALKPFLEGNEDLDPDAPLVEAFSRSLIVAAKIAAAHGMGYDEDALCGNIVCCKRSLEAAQRSVTALEELARQGTVPATTITPLLEEGREICTLVEQHIAELRSRVWWQ